MLPFPEKVRPSQFDEIMGQDDIWSPDAPLRALVEKRTLQAILLWGPPGTGKTTLASVIAAHSGLHLQNLSAVSAGVKEIRAVIAESQENIDAGQEPLLMFMDEIHRLSKSQQDVLLPALEKGIIKFIGATTENPSFEVNKAILSRLLVFQLKLLSQESLLSILKQALRKINEIRQIEDDVLQNIANYAGGDARKALNLLNALLSSARGEIITADDFTKWLPHLTRSYDKDGDSHYDIVSAMIKSIRASHPDAALHYLARMIDGGEEPTFIARRLVIAASEDIGNANPTALIMATSAMQAVHMVGYPEARIILGQVVTYLSSSPKSNRAYEAINAALKDTHNYPNLEVPLHLRNAPTEFMKSRGYGAQYIYPPENAQGAKELTYLPPQLRKRRYYQPIESGVEKQLKDNLDRLRPIND